MTGGEARRAYRLVTNAVAEPRPGRAGSRCHRIPSASRRFRRSSSTGAGSTAADATPFDSPARAPPASTRSSTRPSTRRRRPWRGCRDRAVDHGGGGAARARGSGRRQHRRLPSAEPRRVAPRRRTAWERRAHARAADALCRPARQGATAARSLGVRTRRATGRVWRSVGWSASSRVRMRATARAPAMVTEAGCRGTPRTGGRSNTWDARTGAASPGRHSLGRRPRASRRSAVDLGRPRRPGLPACSASPACRAQRSAAIRFRRGDLSSYATRVPVVSSESLSFAFARRSDIPVTSGTIRLVSAW